MLKTSATETSPWLPIAAGWDGNETGSCSVAARYCAFPLAYRGGAPASYAPLIARCRAALLWVASSPLRTSAAKLPVGLGPCGRLDAVALSKGMRSRLRAGTGVSGRASGGGWYDWMTPFAMPGVRSLTDRQFDSARPAA